MLHRLFIAAHFFLFSLSNAVASNCEDGAFRPSLSSVYYQLAQAGALLPQNPSYFPECKKGGTCTTTAGTNVANAIFEHSTRGLILELQKPPYIRSSTLHHWASPYGMYTYEEFLSHEFGTLLTLGAQLVTNATIASGQPEILTGTKGLPVTLYSDKFLLDAFSTLFPGKTQPELRSKMYTIENVKQIASLFIGPDSLAIAAVELEPSYHAIVLTEVKPARLKDQEFFGPDIVAFAKVSDPHQPERIHTRPLFYFEGKIFMGGYGTSDSPKFFIPKRNGEIKAGKIDSFVQLSIPFKISSDPTERIEKAKHVLETSVALMRKQVPVTITLLDGVTYANVYLFRDGVNSPSKPGLIEFRLNDVDVELQIGGHEVLSIVPAKL